MKILLAVDGSKYTKKMLAYLGLHPELFSASNDYTVFNAQLPMPAWASAAVGVAALKDFHAQDAEKVIAPVCKFLTRHGIDAKSAWKMGVAGPVIAKSSEAGKFDLLLLGSHGHGALGNLVMGSVATQVLARCKTPVLLVR